MEVETDLRHYLTRFRVLYSLPLHSSAYKILNVIYQVLNPGSPSTNEPLIS